MTVLITKLDNTTTNTDVKARQYVNFRRGISCIDDFKANVNAATSPSIHDSSTYC